MRVAAQVTLTASERRRLETWASARSTAVRLVERSKIILMACAGMTNQAIAHALGIDQNTVGRWRNRFVKEGAKGIEKERPRGGNYGGKDSKQQEKLRARIVKATTQTTPKDATHWSTRTMALGDGDDAQFCPPCVAIAWFETASDPHLQNQQRPAIRGEVARRGGAVSESTGERGGVQLRRKELGAGTGQDAAGLTDQEGTLRYDDARLQAPRDDYVVRGVGRGDGPSQILRKLAAYPRQNELAAALREVGRIERSLFMIDWTTDPGMRRRVQVGLNKGEAHHALKRAINFHQRGELRDRTGEGQHYRVAGLNLLAAIIIYWNTLKLGEVVFARQKAGLATPAEFLAHVSPLGWEHINLTGEYRWPRTGTGSTGSAKPLA